MRFGIDLILLLGLNPRDRLDHLLISYLSAPNAAKSPRLWHWNTRKKRSLTAEGTGGTLLENETFHPGSKVFYSFCCWEVGLVWLTPERVDPREFQQHSHSWVLQTSWFSGWVSNTTYRQLPSKTWSPSRLPPVLHNGKFHRCLTWLPWGKSNGSTQEQHLGKFHRFSIRLPGKFSRNPCGQIPIELHGWSCRLQFPDSASSLASFSGCLIYLSSSSVRCFPVAFWWIQLPPYLAFQQLQKYPHKQIHSKFLQHPRKWLPAHLM